MNTEPEGYLQDVLDCIKDIRVDIGSGSDFTHQREIDFRQGFFRKKGVLVPIETVIHRIHLEEHELLVLDSYVLLAEQILSEPGNRMNYFALRTLHEIGFSRIDTLFADPVSEEDRMEFKRIESLSDLVQVPTHTRDFLRLLNDEREKLDQESRKLFESVESILKEGGQTPPSKIKKIRHLTNNRLPKYIKDVDMPEILREKTDFNYLRISLSHILHGNPIGIRVAVHPDFAESNKNHALVVLWNTGLNILIRTKPFVTDEKTLKNIDRLVTRAEDIWDEFQRRRLAYRSNKKK
ncbi:MAG: hypothetical protein OQJ98_03180 [Candidatus Pacebacteria bacterium]|nr:hypothetical protein [Candidatus Paceibacterota bacterium]